MTPSLMALYAFVACVVLYSLGIAGVNYHAIRVIEKQEALDEAHEVAKSVTESPHERGK